MCCMPHIRTLFDLSGQVAVVTGGSRGLGREIAEGLAEAGAALMLVARREQWLSPTVTEMKAAGFACEGMICDVTDPDQVEAVVQRTLEVYGGVHILVNNAGVSWGAPIEDMPLDKWHLVVETNLTGAFLFSQRAGRSMLARGGGSIINVASVAGLKGMHESAPSTVGYVASKGGLIAMTREFAARWGRRGVRANCIAPGYFPSRMTEKVLPMVQARVEEQIPLGRIGREGELKGVAVFLASQASSHITGQTIVVDGGASIV
jgi:NAD(P)-dependent dehydrogenase (short-subunit alcohol dehydrogenase family)